MATVYLLHFTSPLAHARHYIGTARDLEARLKAHHNGTGARLTAVLNEKGIEYTLARTWNGGRKLERMLKRYKKPARFCPICNPRTWANNGKVSGSLMHEEPADLDAVLNLSE